MSHTADAPFSMAARGRRLRGGPHLPGISILTSRPTGNVYPPPSGYNAPAKLLSAGRFRRSRQNLKAKNWRLSHPLLKYFSFSSLAPHRNLFRPAARAYPAGDGSAAILRSTPPSRRRGRLTLRQQAPLLSGGLDQASACSHQALLQARQRPVFPILLGNASRPHRLARF
jgi:hypothetical protein